MEREFVPYALAMKLKALGFDEPCFGYYVDGELRGINLGIEELGGIEPYYQRFGFHTLSNHNIDNPNKIVVTAPTFSQAFRWFRETYRLDGKPEYFLNNFYCFIINDMKQEDTSRRLFTEFPSYEEAELACLEKLIEIVENKSE